MELLIILILSYLVYNLLGILSFLWYNKILLLSEKWFGTDINYYKQTKSSTFAVILLSFPILILPILAMTIIILIKIIKIKIKRRTVIE
jgi:hypothetical protein